MTTATDPHHEQITEPMRVLYLNKAGFATREIGKLLNLSQSTVTRRLKDAAEMEVSEKARRLWMTVMFVLLTMSAMVTAIAMAWRAWGS